MIITKEILQLAKSRNNGYSKTQLNLIGIEKLEKGWSKKIIGKDFDKDKIELFLKLKDAHL